MIERRHDKHACGLNRDAFERLTMEIAEAAISETVPNTDDAITCPHCVRDISLMMAITLHRSIMKRQSKENQNKSFVDEVKDLLAYEHRTYEHKK